MMVHPNKFKHSVCDDCWAKLSYAPPVRISDPEQSTCCFCGRAHASGIFYRADLEPGMHCEREDDAPSTAPPVAAVFVSKTDAPEPCTRCPEGTSPHPAHYALKWRDGSLQCERLACKRALPDLIESVLLGDAEA